MAALTNASSTHRVNPHIRTVARLMFKGHSGLVLAYTLALGLLDEPLFGGDRERLERLLRGIEKRLSR